MSVDETTGRAAIERVLEGIAGTQEVAGVMPGGEEARNWAAEVALKQIKVHEEREARQGIDDLKGIGPPPEAAPSSASALDRMEIPDDAIVINNPIDDLATPHAKAHMGFIPGMPPEDKLMMARLEALTRLDPLTGLPQWPEWYDRIEKAKQDGEHKAMTSGSDLDRTDHMRRVKFMAVEVIKVLDLSSKFFGDWDKPKVGVSKLFYVDQGARK